MTQTLLQQSRDRINAQREADHLALIRRLRQQVRNIERRMREERPTGFERVALDEEVVRLLCQLERLEG